MYKRQLEWVLLIDLTSFLVGAGMLLARVLIPRTAQTGQTARGGAMDGLRFLDQKQMIGEWEVPLLRNGFRLVVFSLIIMVRCV